jgi:hypothetical protein
MLNDKKISKDFLLLSLFLLFCLSLPFSTSFRGSADAKTAPSLCKISHPSDTLTEWECRRLRKGENLESLFGDRWQDVARFNRIDRRHIYPGVYLKIPKRLDDIRAYTPMPRHYQPAESEEKYILVDLSEQFLAAYEYGRLKFSSPIASGEKTNMTPVGEFRITAVSRKHRSSLYFIENTATPYPMNYGLRFHINNNGVAFWIHGRDLPGYPASHGCIGLYDETMQKKYYGYPKKPELEDARKLFEWVVSPLPDDGGFHILENGPKVVIFGHAPAARPSSR